MKILFLHGWHSVPGGVKPTHLRNANHAVLNPALNDDDFEAAVRTAQAEYHQHQPDVIVGSSRGGAVAMNIRSGRTPLVLLCPAWKRWGTATTAKPNTTIFHSRQDETIPFSDSEELVVNSGLPAETLVEVGQDHRLADPEPLRAMVEACERTRLEHIRKAAIRLREAIDRTLAEYPHATNLPLLAGWPKNRCDSPYLFIMLYRLGCRSLIRRCADVSCFGEPHQRHEWLVIEGITVDITADQFPNVSEKAIVARHSRWHEGLSLIEKQTLDEAKMRELYEQFSRLGCCAVFEEILPMYAPTCDVV